MLPIKRVLPDQGGDMWERSKSTIRQLYENERKTLREVKTIMEAQYGFPVTPYLRDGLGLRKKLKKAEWSVVYHRYKNRKGKQTGVYLNGTQIPWKKAWKEIRRSGARSTSGAGDQDVRLPPGVDVRTPSPEPRPVVAPHLLAGQTSLPDSSPESLEFPLSLPFVPLICSTLIHYSQNSPLPSQGYRYPWSSDLFLEREARTAKLLERALEENSVALRDIPWNVFKYALLSIANTKLYIPPNERDWIQGDYRLNFNFIKPADFRLGPNLSETWRKPLPSTVTPFTDQTSSSSKVPALNFDAYSFLTKAVYLLSNNLVKWLPHDPCPEIFKIVLNRIPLSLLDQLFRSDLPTIRAAWTFSVRCAGHCGYRAAFSLLVEAGLRHEGWIRPIGSLCLSLAVSMGALDTARRLIEAGVRADDVLEVAESDKVAMVQAAATGNLECVRLLLDVCDVNRVVKRWEAYDAEVSTFGVFLSTLAAGRYITTEKRDHEYIPQTVKRTENGAFMVSISLDNERQSQVLDMLLSSGANVDATWKGGMFSTVLHFYQAEGIPIDWRPTLLEQSYYWDINLFQRLAPYSSRLAARFARPGICLSAKQGGEALHQYLESRLAEYDLERKAFLELILAEQFMMHNMNLDTKVVRGLIEFGVDPKLPSLRELDVNFLLYRLVSEARWHGYSEEFDAILICLLQSGAVINSEVLEAGVEDDGFDVLHALFRRGADVKRFGAAALSTAARLNSYAAVSLLLEAGVDINAAVNMDSRPWSIIALACNTRGFLPPSSRYYERALRRQIPGSATCEMLEYLTGRGAKLKNSPSDLSGFHFLHRLLLTSSRDCSLLNKMRFLLDSRLDPQDLSNPEECLLEACLNPKDRPSETETKDRLAILELLIENGAPIETSRVLPSLISYGGRHELLVDLLEAGVDINAYSRGNGAHSFPCTPVQAAAGRGDKELVAFLVERGANINQPAHGNRGKTALQAACGWDPASFEEKEKKLSLVQFLIDEGAEVNAPAASSYGCTAMQHAAALGDMETTLLLIHHKANPNALPYRRGGRCALDAAANFGRLDVVQLLLNVGGLSYNQGRTGYEGAIQCAKSLGYFAVADLIQRHIASNTKYFGLNIAMTFWKEPGELDESDESSDYSESGSSYSTSW
ncbi:hypothetical protein AAE478_001969 [Parahypoxylon ruwenzoriense]